MNQLGAYTTNKINVYLGRDDCIAVILFWPVLVNARGKNIAHKHSPVLRYFVCDPALKIN